jgi:molybdopterin/thiamine biosynthesis adenylyltransferase
MEQDADDAGRSPGGFELAASGTGFSHHQLQRYHRQIVIPGVGEKGQEKILKARILIVGAGGLGCPVGFYLAAAGVGTIGIIDDDYVELSNLQRQIAYNVNGIGRPKTELAKAAFESLNPGVRVVCMTDRVRKENVFSLFADYDIVVDCSDNFPTRFLVNDACVMMEKPLVSGAVLGFEGQVTTIIPSVGHCYRCLFEEMPPPGFVPSCQEAGILGAVAGVVGSLQAMEVLKLLLGKGKPLQGAFLIYDALNADFRSVKVPRNPECPACGKRPGIAGPPDFSAA